MWVIVAAIIYMILPPQIQAIALLINIFVPDGCPCVDEVAMAIGILVKAGGF